ncbi:unnamed protein product [Lymnaea stagnalis]|uniref:Uncharacterized protein n=1 Tax=Lymnaea stagnalis TaxID=6523 RepID=A0AAV2IT82_LYMST
MDERQNDSRTSLESFFSRETKCGPEEIECFIKLLSENWSQLNDVCKTERLMMLTKLLAKYGHMLPSIEHSFKIFNIAAILMEILKQSPEIEDSKEERSSFVRLQRTALHICAAASEISAVISKELANNYAIHFLTLLMGKDGSYWELEEKEFLEVQRNCVEALINVCRRESDVQAFREIRVKWIFQKYLDTKDNITRIAVASTLIKVYAPECSYREGSSIAFTRSRCQERINGTFGKRILNTLLFMSEIF